MIKWFLVHLRPGGEKRRKKQRSVRAEETFKRLPKNLSELDDSYKDLMRELSKR